MGDGCRLKAVKLVECVVDASVRDEVVDIVVFGGHARLVGDEG